MFVNDHERKELKIKYPHYFNVALKGHTEEINSANFSNKDGSQVVTASDDNTVRIYNASGNEIRVYILCLSCSIFA